MTRAWSRALGGLPGVRTKRFGTRGDRRSSNARPRELDGAAERRAARYRCVLAFLMRQTTDGERPGGH
jgi:inosine/xanthosine triphosphate pyrophosphatase family protein